MDLVEPGVDYGIGVSLDGGLDRTYGCLCAFATSHVWSGHDRFWTEERSVLD